MMMINEHFSNINFTLNGDEKPVLNITREIISHFLFKKSLHGHNTTKKSVRTIQEM